MDSVEGCSVCLWGLVFKEKDHSLHFIILHPVVWRGSQRSESISFESYPHSQKSCLLEDHHSANGVLPYQPHTVQKQNDTSQPLALNSDEKWLQRGMTGSTLEGLLSSHTLIP